MLDHGSYLRNCFINKNLSFQSICSRRSPVLVMAPAQTNTCITNICLFVWFFCFNAIRVFVRRMGEYQGLKKGD